MLTLIAEHINTVPEISIDEEKLSRRYVVTLSSGYNILLEC